MKSIEFQAMGSRITAYVDQDSSRVDVALHQVPVWFEEWEQIFSRFRPDSELSMVNRESGSRVAVSETFWLVLQYALQIERDSTGLVTPLILPALEMAGYRESFDQIYSHAATGQSYAVTPETPGLDQLLMDFNSKTIRLPYGGKLDFGGIVKGWAAHVSMLRLAQLGPALVNAGGDIAISSAQQSGQAWQISVIDPHEPQKDLGWLRVGQQGVATSGRDYRHWQWHGQENHHIIDPRTGYPAETDLMSATVVASDVLKAEMAAKMVMIMGSQSALDWLNQKHDLEALMVLPKGTLLETNHLQQYQWSVYG